MNYLIITLLLVLALLTYFKIAKRFNIVDVPNHRSSHTEVTVRGGGIIFPLSIIFCGLLFQDVDFVLLIALTLISAISFADDVRPLPAFLRLAVHLLSVLMAVYALQVHLQWPLWGVALACIFMISGINAFNFMDGINGITATYSVITLLTFWYINSFVIRFADDPLLVCPLIACIIFLFFNFRQRALCFAGDVGSIGIAFWLGALSVMLIIHSHNLKYLFVFSIYGSDVLFTIIKRIKLKQNLAQPHRLHLYQLLVNHAGYPHRVVAICYTLAQLTINGFLLLTNFSMGIYALLLLSICAAVYIYFERRYRTLSTVSHS